MRRRLHHRARRFASVGLALTPLAISFATGVTTGRRELDHVAGAPAARCALLLAAAVALVATTRAVAARVAMRLDERARSAKGLLPGSVALGPGRRWATWLSIAASACAVTFLLAEHRPDPLDVPIDVLPARVRDVLTVAVFAAMVATPIRDLAVGARVRRWPWSPARPSRVHARDADVLGTLSRSSPLLLGAFGVGLGLYIASFAAAGQHPIKLMSALGATLLYIAGVFAAPMILTTAGEVIDPVWQQRWFPQQLVIAARVRSAVVATSRVGTVLHVGLAALILGSWSAGVLPPQPVVTAWPVTAALTTTTSWMRRSWAPVARDAAPIPARAVDQYARPLTMLAGLALIAGTVLSLVGILAGP